MRGKAGPLRGLSGRQGITPACAGKRAASSSRAAARSDHPRVCGEKHPSTAIRQRNTGSPPRVRGKVRVQAPVQEHRGITPDCAGKSGRESGTRACCRDHPRACGEKVPITCVPKYALGSPPHVRGKAFGLVLYKVEIGITPACAGKSCPPQAPTFTRQDHPRVCGEKYCRRPVQPDSQGSPPRMRGKVPSSI